MAASPPAQVAVEVQMPRLSDSMEEGTILNWLKSEGDEVAVGDELVEIETDKANMVYEADASGTLVEIVAAKGDTLPVGAVIAIIGDADAKPGRPDTSNASPVARRIADAQGLDLSRISGSGRGGRIVKSDVEAALASPPEPTKSTPSPRASSPRPGGPPATRSPLGPAGPAGAHAGGETAKGEAEIVELSKLQQTVARRMSESKATAPHFYLETAVDVTRAFDARAALKKAPREDGAVPSFNDIVVRACATALREFPRANAAYRDGQVEEFSRINIGVAVAAQEALVVPTVFDADRKRLREIAAETRRLAARVRDESITPPELSGGTFTVSNLGMFGITSFAAVINPPQAAILAIGSIDETPVVRGGEIAIGHRMALNLACDHRVLYGADGARFLARVRRLLEQPLGLAL